MQGLAPVFLVLPVRETVEKKDEKAPACFVGLTDSSRLGSMTRGLGWYREGVLSRY